ncbi:MAG: LysR family transcriptional regulator [Proteobacteria bacterium]|nr:LysR family transcriptional regulator [Pseudomonadota bacterium]
MDRFDALAAFVRVAELRGFAPAARQIGISPSAATRLVAGLEDHLGLRLLQRTTRSVSLTDAGARYLDRARAILADLTEADEAARAERTVPSGRLVVSAPSVFGRLHVASLICSFLRTHTEVTGELQLTDRIVNLVEEGIDLAVRIGNLADSSVVARRMGATRRVIVASPGYLAERGTPRRPDDLQRHRTIHFSGITAPAEWRFVEDGRERRVVIAPRYETNSADAAIGHAEQGGGLAWVLAYQAAEAVAARRLKIVLAKFEIPPLAIQFVYPAARLLSAKVRAFIDMAEQDCDWSFDAR